MAQRQFLMHIQVCCPYCGNSMCEDGYTAYGSNGCAVYYCTCVNGSKRYLIDLPSVMGHDIVRVVTVPVKAEPRSADNAPSEVTV